MEICVIQNRRRKTYGGNISYGYLSILNEFLDSVSLFNNDDFDYLNKWLESDKPVDLSLNYVELEKLDGYISMYLTYTDADFANRLEIKKEKLRNILEAWDEIMKENPREIIITWIDDNIKLEGQHFVSSIFDNLDLKKCKFKDDSNINYTLFPKDWNKEKIKTNIMKVLEKPFSQRIEIEDKVLSNLSTQDNVKIKVIVNDKCEILAAYPIHDYTQATSKGEK